MRQVKTQKNYTRRQMIEDTVAAYVRNNPKEYRAVVENVKEKRKELFDEKFGLVKDKDAAKNYDMRHQFRIPEKIAKTVEVLLEAHQQERLFDVKGEDKWFATSYPEFYIPTKF